MAKSVRLFMSVACLAFAAAEPTPRKKAEFYYQNLETGNQKYTRGFYETNYYPADNKY